MKQLQNQFGFTARLLMLMFSILAIGCTNKDPILGSSGSLASLAPTVTATTPLATNPMATDIAINSKLTATFSKDIASSTINNSTFSVACPMGTPITGSVSYIASSRIATFFPNAVLPANTVCTATISTALRDTTGLALANDFVWTFKTGATPDITRPTVTLTAPVAAAINVAFNEKVTATFSEDMDPLTITGNTILLQGATGAVTGTVTYAAGSRTATFSPSSPLAASTVYTATVTTGTKDLAGNALANNTVWTFTTGVAPDITRPTVTLKVPDAGASNVAINSKVLITFSELMDTSTITTANILVKNGNVPLTGTLTYAVSAKTATFIPSSPFTLPPSTLLTVLVNTEVKDLAGNSLAGDVSLLPAASDAVWTFTTGLTPDTTLPTVTLKVPAAGATGVPVNTMITATFSEDMDPLFIRENSFSLKSAAGTTITGIVSYAVGSRTAIFIPTVPTDLAFNTLYTATLKNTIKDVAGNSLAGNNATPLVAEDAVWTFRTGAAPDVTPPTVTTKIPDAGAVNVAPNSNILVAFSEDMDPLTITSNTILVQGSSVGLVTGTVTYAVGAKTATFNPTSPASLPTGNTFTVIVTTGAKDLAGNALVNNATWNFSTIDTPDTTRPTVTLLVPSAGATGVAFNAKITATFSEDMNPSSIDETTFTVRAGAIPILGSVTYAVGAKTATFTPISPLPASTILTATINTGAKDLANNLLASNAVWSFTTSATPDVTPPTVTNKVPAVNATNVATNASVIISFSEDMDPLTITGNTILLQGSDNGAITGTVTYAVGAKTATFNPTSPASLPTGNTFTVIVTTGAKDLAGNALTNNVLWTFSTGATPDTTRPTVTLKVPANGATAVAFNAKVVATFSEDMDPSSIDETTFTVRAGATPILGSVTYAVGAKTATFTPISTLAASTILTATVNTGAKDLANNLLANNAVWSFTTSATPDVTPPTVTNKVPAVNATNVATNASVIISFSEDMDPLTITGNTILLQGSDNGAITGTVTYAVGAKTATFNPTSPASLPTGNTFTVIVTTGAKDLAGNALTNNVLWTFSTGATPDTTRPTVTLKVPANGATAVAFNAKVVATFSEDMDPATMVGANFTVKNGATNLNGTVGYSAAARTITFTPSINLPASTVLTATLTTGSQDLAGNALAGNIANLPAASNAVWTFTTSAAPDTTRPTVTLKVPAAGATAVATNAKVIVTFSEDMDPASISNNTVILQGPGANAIVGDISYAVAARTATFTPTSPASLPFNTLFTATVTTGALDLAGNALLNNSVWTFSTGAAPDSTPPTITKVNPLEFASGVCLQKTINATFSESIDPLTINTATMSLKTTAGSLTNGTVSYNVLNKMATFTPSSDLLANTNYTATVTTGVKDLANNALNSNKVWTFSTGSQACAQAVNLGTAAPFGNLGGAAGTTNQGTLTVIGGDLGTTAVSTSAITGFHDTANDIYTETGSNQGFVNGKIYTCTVSTTGPTAAAVNPVACSIAVQARSDATTAFNQLAPGAMPGGTDPGAGQLGGLTLASGIYQAAGGSFQITGSDLTLDGQGDADAVWIFQTATSLTVGAAGAPRSIILINGAQAKNVFWRVGTAATINAAGGGTMAGTIIASAAVSISTVGNVAVVTVNGRAMGLNASVTMTNTVINVPAQ